jgi:hypothetical protein
MRKIVYGFIAVIILGSTACTKSTGGNGNNGGNNNSSSLTISVDKSTLFADGYDEAILTVKDQTGADVTSTVTLKRNGSNTARTQVFEFGTHGSYKYTATNGTITSNEITITVNDPGAAKYTTKIIAEDCTGTWCGWCPRLTYKFEKFMHYNPRIYTVGVHNNDVFALSSIESALRSKFSITSFPSAIINRTEKFADNGNIMSLADSAGFRPYLQTRAVSGLAINSTVSGNNLNITAKVKFDANIKNPLKLVVLVTEDGLIRGQVNYYNNNATYPGNPYFSAGATIANFVHNGVLRSTPTGIFGVDVPTASQTKNNEYTANFVTDISGLVTTNTKVVAFVVFADGQIKKGILNAQWAAAGTNKNYD